MLSTLNLFIFCIEQKEFKYKIVSRDPDNILLPYMEIQPYMNIEESIAHMISCYIKNYNTSQINYKFSDISIEDNIDLYYYTFLHYEPELKNSFTIPVKQYEKNLPNIQKIIGALH